MDDQIIQQNDEAGNDPVQPASEKDNSKMMAALAYLLFFIPLLSEYKDNEYVKFHVKQSILILLVGVGIGVVSSIPLIGWVVAPLASIGLMILWVIGIINAWTGKKTPIPYIGKYAETLLKF